MTRSLFSIRRVVLTGLALLALLAGFMVASKAFGTGITVGTTADAITNGDGCSLREAIQAANTNLSVNECPAGENNATDTITLANGATYDLTIAGADEDDAATGDLDILWNDAAVDLVITVAGGGTATINQTTNDRVLQIRGDASVNITNVTISGGNISSGATPHGGGLASGVGTVNLTGVVFKDNTATGFGGGIYNDGTMLITGNSLIGGSGDGNTGGVGGGIYQANGTLTVQNSTISHNVATDLSSGGGGAFVGGLTAVLNIDNSTVSANTGNFGGGIAAYGHVNVTNGSVIGGDTDAEGNHATNEAGGLYNEQPTSLMTVSDSTVSHNISDNIGGGLSNYQGAITVTNSKILSNNASNEGDAFYNHYATVDTIQVTNSCIVNNGSTAFYNNTVASQTATGNWWGQADGPGGVASGHGDSVSLNVTTTGFLTSAPAGCPIRGVVVSKTSVNVAEGGATDTYTVVLTAKPTASVTVSFSTGSQVQAIASKIFTTSDWMTPQTVTVTAVNDDVDEASPHTQTITHSASGGGFTGVSIASVTANITDDDTRGVTITESGGSTDVVEGGATDSYTVVLTSQPTATVTITLGPDTQVQTSVPTLTFTTGNWNIAQPVTVTAVDDAVVEGAHTGAITHTASGGDYGPVVINNVVANITDNEGPGVVITETGGSTDVAEGGATDTYSLALSEQPGGDVTITFDTGSQIEPIGSLTFTNVNYATPQDVTVTAVDDLAVEGNHTGTISHTASGGGYDSVTIADVTVNITDNDLLVKPPVLLKPKNKSAVYTHLPKFTWKKVKDAVQYHIQIDDNDTFTSPLEADVTGLTFTVPSGSDLPFGTYFWHVKADMGGGVWTEYTTPFTFDVTLLKKPKKDTAIRASRPTFTWQKVKGATYHIKVWDSAGCGVNLVWEADSNKPTYKTKADQKLELGTYFWQVTADGVNYTPCWRFDVTLLKSPRNGSALLTTKPKLSWQAVPGSKMYHITVTDSSSANVVDTDKKTPSFKVPAPLAYDRYTWHVASVLGVTTPNTPDFVFFITNMAKPRNETFTLDSTPTFLWKKIGSGVQYTLVVACDGGYNLSFGPTSKLKYTPTGAQALPSGDCVWHIETSTGITMPEWSFVVGP